MHTKQSYKTYASMGAAVRACHRYPLFKKVQHTRDLQELHQTGVEFPPRYLLWCKEITLRSACLTPVSSYEKQTLPRAFSLSRNT